MTVTRRMSVETSVLVIPYRRPDARADLLPLGSRELQAEVVEPAGPRIEGGPRSDEVQQVLPAGRLEEHHPLVGEGDFEPEDVDVEALGGGEVARLEGQVAKPAIHTAHHIPAPGRRLRRPRRAGRAPLSDDLRHEQAREGQDRAVR